MAVALIVLAVLIAVGVEALLRRRRAGPATAAGYLRRGDRALARGRMDEAASACRAAIELDHSNPVAHFCLSKVLFAQGDLDGAILELNSFLRWGPELPEIHSYLGALHYRKGDLEAALAHDRRAAELAPDDQDLREQLAEALWATGRLEEARDVLPEFEPPDPEETAREERLRAQLKGTAERRLARWDAAANSVAWVWRVSRIALVSWIAWQVLTFVYELGGGRGSAPKPGAAMKVVAVVGLVGVWATILTLRGMEAYRDRFVRGVMRRAGVSEEDVDAAVPRETGPAWWRVETSGMHLALWIALPAVIIGLPRGHLPDWAGFAIGYALFAWILKFGFWMGLLLVERDRRPAWRRWYRWFGTLKGALFALVGVPGIVVALVMLIYGVALLLGAIP
ncbi:MAG: tetratricopeptide repeat protein [Armatimonadota bacterium]